MAEIKTPLIHLKGGDTFTVEDGAEAYAITDKHTHSDILRYIIEDEGARGALTIMELLVYNDITPKERVEIELQQLKARANSLMSFASSPSFDTIPVIQQQLLNAQLMAMQAYCHILQQRLERWDG